MNLCDKNKRPFKRGDIVKVYHFTGARRKRYYMYKQCLGVNRYRYDGQDYMFFSHLNFIDTIDIKVKDSPYHERLDGGCLETYEIVQSIDDDFEMRERVTNSHGKGPISHG